MSKLEIKLTGHCLQFFKRKLKTAKLQSLQTRSRTSATVIGQTMLFSPDF